MITKLIIKNFKRLNETDISLDNTVVFVGPNNSGKTSALQAIALWDIGMRKWAENREKSKSRAKQRVGVLIHRSEILTVPLTTINQLWNNLHVRESIKIDVKKYKPQNILIEITAEGFTKGKTWQLGFEFYYANPDGLYCRRIETEEREFPAEVLEERVGFLPPMSGLASEEDLLQIGSINVRIGQGRTAEVLRNLCWIIFDKKREQWKQLVDEMKHLFSIKLREPQYDPMRSRITMSYDESGNEKMDLSNAGRGFHQVLLLFAYIYANESTILLLDEPDAHLEILRQDTIYSSLAKLIRKKQSQLIVATHSEVVLNKAAEERDRIIAFLGKPHVVNKKDQLIKSLKSIGFEQYLLAEQRKWVLYLEGSTDLSMLKAFADVLNHPVKEVLESPFVKYVGNHPPKARDHFYGLRECTPELQGIALFDHRDKSLDQGELKEIMWQRCEIENYLPIPEVVEKYINGQSRDLFQQHNIDLMVELIHDYIPPAALKDKAERWWWTTKMSDDVLDKVFRKYFEKLHMPILIDKRNYYELAMLAEPKELDAEITEKLDAIYEIANKAEHT